MSGFATLQDKLIQAKRVMDVVENNPKSNNKLNEVSQSQTLPPISNTFNNESINNVIRSNNNMTKPTVTEEKVKNSNLPDEIKKLMIDHPIPEVSFGNQIPDSLIEGAAEKMKKLSGVSPTKQSYTPKTPNMSNSKTQKLTQSSLKNLIRETLKDSLNDLIKESISERIVESKGVNENVQIVVGSTVFNGKITSTKKIN
jgi:hypothetical protein